MRRLMAATLFLLATGCVQRKMTVTSDPPGALVVMNNEEVGRTPFTRDFTFYGTYDVQLRAEGYETLSARTPVIAPWWQWPPIDLFAEVMPWGPTDRRTLHYTLTPRTTTEVDPATLVKRAESLKTELGTSRVEKR